MTTDVISQICIGLYVLGGLILIIRLIIVHQANRLAALVKPPDSHQPLRQNRVPPPGSQAEYDQWRRQTVARQEAVRVQLQALGNDLALTSFDPPTLAEVTAENVDALVGQVLMPLPGLVSIDICAERWLIILALIAGGEVDAGLWHVIDLWHGKAVLSEKFENSQWEHNWIEIEREPVLQFISESTNNNNASYWSYDLATNARSASARLPDKRAPQSTIDSMYQPRLTAIDGVQLDISRTVRVAVREGSYLHFQHIETGRQLRVIQAHPEVIALVRASTVHGLLLTASVAGELKLWHFPTANLPPE